MLALAKEETPALIASDGSRAELAGPHGEERLAVRDARGALLFEYEPSSGRASVYVPAGDLRLCAGGDIELVAGGAILAASAHGVAVSSSGPVSLESKSAEGPRAGMRLAAGELALAGEALSVGAERARFRLRDTTVEGVRAAAVFGEARLAVEKLETVAGRVIARAKHVFERVEELHELRAGRFRAIVKKTLDLKAEAATLRAERDVRIDGDKINLG